ncbi:hypothetical protein PLEOSDRAFT_158910 [Pleurotus ostreatus PC15]|uniref:Uncharacterized protein n=1 Tax=Pleurotus ostreatus (strain PC15) TaxID=1137138 RepID=A0A067NGJ6_PLEO1|nr:hypothetical protein PLEOSDRAFT_158910 [Pleurotus ostreatus PC15]
MNTYPCRFSAPRLLPEAGYYDDPGPIPFLSKLILSNDQPKSSGDVSIAGRRFELWSPNSRRLPFYPGIKTPGVDLEDLARGRKRYDGHLGPLDPTYHPQHYQPSRPYLPFIRRHGHLNSPREYPEFTSVFDVQEVWQPDPLSCSNGGRIRGAYINRLRRRNKTITEEMLALRDGLRRSGLEALRLLWKRRPVFPSDMDLVDLEKVDTFDEAVDTITSMQRGIKYRDAWTRYARMKDQAPFDPADTPFTFAVEGNERFMGIWVSDDACEDVMLYLTREGVACFFLYEYCAGEESYHHRTHSTLPLDLMQSYSLVFAQDAPWKRAERRSNLRALALGEGESVGRVRSLPGYQPFPGSLALSNRQGYRQPSLRNPNTLPVARALRELSLRPATPILTMFNLDGLETDAPEVPSVQEVQARLEREKAASRGASSSKISVRDAIGALGSVPVDYREEQRLVVDKGKQRARSPPSSFHGSYEEESSRKPTTPSRDEADDLHLRAALRESLRTGLSDGPLTSSTSVSSVSRSRSSNAADRLTSERHDELYGPYSFELSEFWRVDRLPSNVRSASDLLQLLRKTAKKLPFEVQQMLCTWRSGQAFYWVRFGDSDQAMRVRGYLSSAGASNSDGCDGPAVPEATYLLALNEVRNPEERPPSPTSYWSIPIMMDTRFARSSLFHPSTVQSAETTLPSQIYSSHARLDSEVNTLKLITPDMNNSASRPPSSPPGPAPLPKRSRANSPPLHFVASRTTRTIRETATSRNTKRYMPLALRLSQPSDNTEDSPQSSRPKGSESRSLHNSTRYHRK